MLGEKGMELIKETARNREGNMGPFNEDKVSQGGAVLDLKCLYWVLWVLWVLWPLSSRIARQDFSWIFRRG